MASIKTRLLIISDTHGALPVPPTDDAFIEDEIIHRDLVKVPTGYREPLPAADVAIHCGDLTTRGTVAEFERTFRMLRSLSAPLKLVIAGNHDLLLDREYWENSGPIAFGTPNADLAQQVQDIIEDARADGVRYLTEGTYEFDLANGAQLSVYASQFSPAFEDWAFQYPAGDHDFAIPQGVDVAMTHGPPYGILDETGLMNANNAGCEKLLDELHRSRPAIHCFGHIHEAWGAYLASWRESETNSNHNSSDVESIIDPGNSREVRRMKGLKPMSSVDEASRTPSHRHELAQLSKQRGCYVDLTEGQHQLERGSETLFVNASIMDIRYRPTNLPWLIDINFSGADTRDKKDPVSNRPL